MEEGLLALTRPMTYQRGEDEGSGLLTPGQYADLVVLSEDPFQVTPQQVASIQVEMTIYRGKIVYAQNTNG